MALAAVAVLPPCANGAWSGSFEAEPGSGIEMRVESAFDTAPRAGFVPCRVNVRNGSASARSWDFSFSTRASDFGASSWMRFDRQFSVPAGQSASFEVLIPVTPSRRGSGYVPGPQIGVSGYGLRSTMLSMGIQSRGAGTETPFVAMSSALALRSWKVLVSELDKRWKLALTGSEVDLALLGDDWRALAGVACLLVSVDEYLALSPAKRHAIRTWVAQGGTLVLCGSGEVRDFGGDLYGLGSVERLEWDGSSELPIARTAELIHELNNRLGTSGSLGDRLSDPSPVWKFAEILGTPRRNVLFLSLFITLFAVTVGPLNLFWFAGSGRRHRLFWTIPLISVVSSLLLGVVILVQDGFVGHGARMTLRYLAPDEKQVLVMQEQVSRTGLLLSRSFAAPPDLFLAPLDAPPSIGARRTSRSYHQNPRGYSGDWFQSRAVQAEFLEVVVPSRESVEIVGINAGRPVVRSSIPVVLEQFYYIDDSGTPWSGKNLRVGENVELSAAGAENPILPISKSAGPTLRWAFDRMNARRGFFYAIAARPAAIETLPAIDWRTDRTICVGPVTRAP